MLGWEFPPFFAGGVGMVCYELTKAFSKRNDIEVTYVMPYGPKNIVDSHVRLLIADNLVPNSKIKLLKVNSLLSAYTTPEEYLEALTKLEQLGSGSDSDLNLDNTKKLYGKNLLAEVYRFKEKIKLIALQENPDIIHAHDWTTFPAAIAAKEATGKPMIAHVHITEFNKSGGLGVNQYLYDIEREGMHKADAVIAVSNLIKNTCIEKYGVDPNKIHVIHNANIKMGSHDYSHDFGIKKHDQIVLFAGRVTLQKGPDYFVDAAKKVCEIKDNVKFVMAGTGDMLPRMIQKAADLGIANKFIFHGFYTREDAEKLFSLADLFVMPSVSEPFGVVPLEAMAKGTPAIISKQSGVAEVLNHVLKVDFWDIDEMANKIIALLNYNSLKDHLSHGGYDEAMNMTWDEPANKCMNLYHELMHKS